VSRTWSRHASIPDWTNQARVVTAPEDIIINRDRSDEDLERGMGIKEKSDGSTAVLGDGEELGEKGVGEDVFGGDGDILGEKGLGEKEGEEGEEGSSDDSTKLGQSQELGVSRSMDLGEDKGELEYLPRQGSGVFPQEKDRRQQAPQGDYRQQAPQGDYRTQAPQGDSQQAPQEDYRKQVPPDGDDTLMEWKEGRQRVIETKRGAGDDVRFPFSFLVFLLLFLDLVRFSFPFTLPSSLRWRSGFGSHRVVFISLPSFPSCRVFFSQSLRCYLIFLPFHTPSTLLFASSSPSFSRLLLVCSDTTPIPHYRSKSRSWTTTQIPLRGQGAKPPFCTISNTALAGF